ncbi:MAG TPA: NADH-quinone oxidoreductase subunit N [Gemmatimonadales bacterium]|nr:NADH-quinone oxidoreductase subunit N [Gemmatimonadales bacterium]
MRLDLSNTPALMLALLPEIVLTGWSLVLLLLVAWRHHSVRDLRLAGIVTLAAFVTTAGAVWWLWWNVTTVSGIPLMIGADDFRFVAGFIILGAAAGTVFFSFDYLEREGMVTPEYYVLLVYAVLGLLLMVAGEDLMVIFLGLELLSVSVYVLAAFNRRSAKSAEAGIKYFLLGAFASAFLVYGIAFIYGATGTTNLKIIGLQVATLGIAGHPLLLVGLGLLLVGFAFKVAAVPFHMWAPDAYDGAPTPVTGFMATAVKAAAVAALFRVLVEAFSAVPEWGTVVAGLAVATMVVGNLVALSQRSVKRMLAYSSVAHAGYLLVAVRTGTAAGGSAALLYLAAYAATTLAGFAILAAKGRHGEHDVLIDDLAGFASERPWLAFAMAVVMLSLLGFPGTAGFIGKWYILVAAVQSGHATLAVILVLTSVVSAGYYLPVIMAMYMRPEPYAGAHAAAGVGRWARTALIVAIAGLLYFGVRPNRLFELTRTSGAAVHPASIGGPGETGAAVSSGN